MHHARSSAVVLIVHPVFLLVFCFFADKAVELMRVSTRSSVEPSTMFSGEHLPPFYLSYFYSIYSLLLIYCYLCCDALVFRTCDIPCSPILPWTHHITCCLVDSWTCAS